VKKGAVLRVKHAIQGHPEAPRLWSGFIDEIIQKKLNLIPTTHEQCLYHGEIDGKRVLFLRQVDDFAVASEDASICNKVIDLISEYLSTPLKNLGIIDRFNGVQIFQTNSYVKIHNEQYIDKILDKHGWNNKQFKVKERCVPMQTESAYIHELELAEGPVNSQD